VNNKNKPNIVVLDGYTLNPGDLSWNELKALGKCTIYDRSAPEKVVNRAKDAQMVLTNKTPLPSTVIKELDQLEYIGVLATGFNIVDIQAASEQKITVTNVPTYGTKSVAQMVFAHVLNITQHVAYHDQTVKQGRWASSKDFCYWDYPLIELSGKTMGIIGLGRIGQETAKLADAFGLNVLAHDVNPPVRAPQTIRMTSLDNLIKNSDIISLHCPLTPKTEKLINAERIEMMKTTAILVNTSRGPLVDEHALADALNNQKITAAGLDVLSEEPPSENNPLIRVKNCYITPHIAWATQSARARLMKTVIENLKSYLEGTPQNMINSFS
jgi:glycerate dehydrogenase